MTADTCPDRHVSLPRHLFVDEAVRARADFVRPCAIA